MVSTATHWPCNARYDNAQIVFNGLNTWQMDGRSLKDAFEEKGVKVFVCSVEVMAKPDMMVSGKKIVQRQHAWLEFAQGPLNKKYNTTCPSPERIEVWDFQFQFYIFNWILINQS